MELPLPGIIGAAVGIGIGLVDYGLVASLVRRAAGRRIGLLSPRATEALMRVLFVVNACRRIGLLSPRATEALMRVLFVVNACAFGALGWWFGVSMAGTGLASSGG
jgi:hypothetical protein